MSYDFNIQNKGNYIRVDVSGTRTPGKEVEDFMGIILQVNKFCDEQGIFRILFITKLAGSLPPLSFADLIEYTKKIEHNKDFRLATVDSNPDSKKTKQMIKTMMPNRVYNFMIFNDEDKAIHWLIES